LDISALGYHLRAEPAGDLHPIVAIEIEGEFHFVQQELAFALTDLGGRRYGSAEAPVLDRPAVWVATTDQAAEKPTISWRTTDGKPVNELPPVPVRAPRFPGLLELSAPPDGPAPTDDNNEQATALLSEHCCSNPCPTPQHPHSLPAPPTVHGQAAHLVTNT
jgi:hypothetical protein